MNGPPIIRDGDVIRCGNGSLERRKGINIVHLQGSYAEMGWQHGKLALEQSGDVVASYFDDVLASLVADTFPTLAGTLNGVLKWLFYALNRKRIGQPLLDQVRTMSEATGLPHSKYARAIFVPDIIHFLIGKSFPGLITPAPGCSGFMARGSATAGGKLIVGRNFDFFGQGVWDENNALIFMAPDAGRRYCWIGALGVPISGQGMNESGLFLSMYTKLNRDVRLTGIPLFTLIGRILAGCETVDEVVETVAAQPRICGVSLLVVDFKNRDAAVLGFSANHMEVVRPENDVLVRTNHYVTDDMKRFEVAPYPWLLNSTARFNRLHELLEERRGRLEPRDVPGMLSDNLDFYEKRPRLAGHILRACNNSQSIVLSPDDDAMWIGNGPYPVCTSTEFEGFRISALFARDRDRYEIDDLAGGADTTPAELEAQKRFQAAWTAHFDLHKDDLAIQHLRRAGQWAPNEPVFPRLAGILLMREHKYLQALPFMRRNAEYDYRHDIMEAEARLWLGRCLDLLGTRDEALAAYRRAAELDCFPVSQAARKHMEKPFRAGGMKGAAPEFIAGTVIARY